MGRRPKRYSQAERLALMVRALASRAWTVNDLAQEFAVTRRQVYRDLARIEENSSAQALRRPRAVPRQNPLNCR